MKCLWFLAFLLPINAFAAAPVTLSQIDLTHVKDPAGIKLTSMGDRTLIAVPPAEDDEAAAKVGAAWYGVDPGMDAQTARVVWTSRLACPLAGGIGEVLATPTLVLCRTDHDVFALAPQDGTVRWRFHHKKNLAPMATAGQRVAVNVDNEELDVLDLANGRVLRRFALHGAPLQAAALSPNGPLAFVVAKVADNAAPGHSHQILAQPLAEAASTTDARIEPLAPLWQMPFGGADYRLVPSQTTLVATPIAGVVDARDLATGHVLWADSTLLLPTLEPLAAGLAVGGIRPDGVRWVGLADPRTKVTTWRRPWTLGALHGVGLDNGHLVWLGDGGWLVTRAKDGQQEATGSVPDDAEVAQVQAADHVLTLLLWGRKTGGSWQQVALGETQPPPPLPAPPQLDWLEPGRQLLVLQYAHGGRDPQTLLPGDGAIGALMIWPTRPHAASFAYQAVGDKPEPVLTRTSTPDALANARSLDLLLAPGVPSDVPALLLSHAAWRTLVETGRGELKLDGAALTLHVDGPASSRLQVRDAAGVFHWADVDVQIAANEDSSVRLWLMPYGNAALAVRMESPKRTWAVMNVDWKPAEPPQQNPAISQQTDKKASPKVRKKK